MEKKWEMLKPSDDDREKIWGKAEPLREMYGTVSERNRRQLQVLLLSY